MVNILELKNLTISTPEGNLLVDDISLHLAPGEILGIVGESGSGKTLTAKTLVNALPRGLNMHYADYRLLGKDIQKLTEAERINLIGKKIGFIPQNTGDFLHPLLKIKNQIIDAYCFHLKAKKKEALLRAKELLLSVGFDSPERILNSFPWELSGGMKQRVNIAMAMMLEPDLLIADEPTTALDCVIQKQVISLLEKINQETKVGIIFISHDLRLIKYFAKRILVMNEGKIVEEGQTEEIFNQPKDKYTKNLLKAIPQITSP